VELAHFIPGDGFYLTATKAYMRVGPDGSPYIASNYGDKYDNHFGVLFKGTRDGKTWTNQNLPSDVIPTDILPQANGDIFVTAFPTSSYRWQVYLRLQSQTSWTRVDDYLGGGTSNFAVAN